MPGCSACSRRRSWASCLRSRQQDAEVQTGLRIIGAGGSGMRLGKTWTILIVAQVGFAVALLPAAVSNAWGDNPVRDCRSSDSQQRSFSPRSLGWIPCRAGDGTREFTRRYAGRQTELMRRLQAEPRVSSVTFSMAIPGDEPGALIETQSVAAIGRGGEGHCRTVGNIWSTRCGLTA